jgi:tRNA pseudouridine65 synthase
MKPRDWIWPPGYLEFIDITSDLVVINKPAGWLTHRTPLAPKEWGVVEAVEKQLACGSIRGSIRAIHRLDRATSGILLLARTREAAQVWSKRFQAHTLQKTYIAIIRGWPEDHGNIDQPLARETDGALQPSRTHYRTLARVEIHESVHPRHPTTRYSLVEAKPKSGKPHQIRKHFEHLRHPIIGDTIYGEGRHNRYFREKLGFPHLALHAQSLQNESHSWHAPLPESWNRLLTALGIHSPFDLASPSPQKGG